MKTSLGFALFWAVACVPPPHPETAMTPLVSAATSLASDGRYLYFANKNANAVLRLALDGGMPEVAYPNQHDPQHLTVSNHTLWWSNKVSVDEAEVMRAPLKKPASPERVYSTHTVYGLAVAGEEAFACSTPGLVQLPGAVRFRDEVENGCSGVFATNGQVFFWPTSPQGLLRTGVRERETVVVTPEPNDTAPTGFATDGTYLYYTLFYGDLRRVALAGGDPTTLLNENFPKDLVLHGRDLYWRTPGEIRTLRLGETVRVETFAAVDGKTSSLLLVGDELIWADRRGGLFRAPVRRATD